MELLRGMLQRTDWNYRASLRSVILAAKRILWIQCFCGFLMLSKILFCLQGIQDQCLMITCSSCYYSSLPMLLDGCVILYSHQVSLRLWVLALSRELQLRLQLQPSDGCQRMALEPLGAYLLVVGLEIFLMMIQNNGVCMQDFIGSAGSIFDLVTQVYPAYFLPLASLRNLTKFMPTIRMEAGVDKLELLVKDNPDIKKDLTGLTTSESSCTRSGTLPARGLGS